MVAISPQIQQLERWPSHKFYQDDLCLQTSEKEMLRKEHGGQESNDASDEVLYKIDIPANRYDMLCLEGIARALNIFNGRFPVPQYRLADLRGISLHVAGRQSMYDNITTTGSVVVYFFVEVVLNVCLTNSMILQGQ